uniref:Putative mitochondrial protein n=1 Tax=Noccaea caerulescens TaxID=107243 RepID=A0A1J3JG90_NOCCA
MQFYGCFRQASRQWFLKFSSVLLSLGFQKIHGDHTLFLSLSVTDTTYMAILVYVDDILISDFVVSLRDHFKLHDLGEMKYFLGLEIARAASGISVGQHKYVLELLRDSGLTGCKPSSIPMDPSNKLSSESGEPLPDAEVYRRLVGKLMYLTITRPDIAFTVSKQTMSILICSTDYSS